MTYDRNVTEPKAGLGDPKSAILPTSFVNKLKQWHLPNLPSNHSTTNFASVVLQKISVTQNLRLNAAINCNFSN